MICYLNRFHSIKHPLDCLVRLFGLRTDLLSGNIGENLQNLQNYVIEAETNYIALLESGFSDRYEANMEYLLALKESIIAFKELAEIS